MPKPQAPHAPTIAIPDKISQIWDEIASDYLAKADTAPHNARLERPVMTALAGPMAGLDVLDLGCGTGFYAARAVAQGAASVVAFDTCQACLDATQARTRGQAICLPVSLQDPWPLETATRDMIVASLCLHYVMDWAPVAQEVARVLRPGGRLLVSVDHPVADREALAETYFTVVLIYDHWPSFGVDMPRFQRNIEAMIAPFRAAGLALTDLREPQPAAELAAENPDLFAHLNAHTSFICLAFQRV